MHIKNDYLLQRVFTQKKPDEEGIERTLFFLYRHIGYEETLRLPVPVFLGLIRFIKENEMVASDGK